MGNMQVGTAAIPKRAGCAVRLNSKLMAKTGKSRNLARFGTLKAKHINSHQECGPFRRQNKLRQRGFAWRSQAAYGCQLEYERNRNKMQIVASLPKRIADSPNGTFAMAQTWPKQSSYYLRISR